MPLDGQQVENIVQRVKELLPDGDHDRISEVIYRAVARQIVEGPEFAGTGRCFPGFRVIEKEATYDPDMTYYRLIYVYDDGSSRRMGMIIVPSETAEDFAGHFGSCKCHTESDSSRTL